MSRRVGERLGSEAVTMKRKPEPPREPGNAPAHVPDAAMNPFEWLEGCLAEIDRNVKGEREQSICAMNTIMLFLETSGIYSDALARLSVQLLELSEGHPPGPMLRKRTKPKRPSDRKSVETAKGGFAAMMEIKMREGLKAKEASQWVINHMSGVAKKKLGDENLTAHTVEKWRERFSGHANPTQGRRNFQRFVTAWEKAKGTPNAAELLLRALENALIPVVTGRE